MHWSDRHADAPRLRADAGDRAPAARASGRIPLAWVHGALFLGAGALAASIRIAPGSDVSVHFRVVLAIGAFLLLGTWMERLLGIDDEEQTFAFHRILLGQIALITYFTARSLATHRLGLPRVSRAEIFALVALAVAVGLRRFLRGASPRWTRGMAGRTARLAILWAAWWVSTVCYLGVRSGELATPSSDPDAHAYMAKLAVLQGQIPYDHLPFSADPLAYPSGFSVLNALWLLLSGLTPVQVVNLQVAIQASLAVGLVLECLFALRGRPVLRGGLLLLAAAHFVFVFPGNSEVPLLQGTPRLSHVAFAILFLSYAQRLGAARGSRAEIRAAGAFVGAFCAAWAITTNPSHLLVILPILAVGALLLVGRSSPRPAADAAARRRSRRVAALAVGVPLLIVASDGWLWTWLRPISGPPSSPIPPEPWNIRLDWSVLESAASWLDDYTLFGVVPDACLPAPHCAGYLVGLVGAIPLLLAVFAAAVFAATRPPRTRPDGAPAGGDRLRECALSIVALLAATWLGIALMGLVAGAFVDSTSRNTTQLRNYTINGLRYLIPIFFLWLLGVGFSAGAECWQRVAAPRLRLRRPSGDAAATAAVLAAAAVLALRNPGLPAEVWQGYVRDGLRVTPSSLGPIEPAAIDFVREAQRIVPEDERVLLPGIVEQTPHETWDYPLASARALPLYSDVHFAFFLGLGPSATSGPSYRERVCDHFDIGWLREHGVRWVFTSDAALRLGGCLYNWEEVRSACFEERLRRGDLALHRLTDRCAPQDPRLHPPTSPASGARPGRGLVGFVDACGYRSVSGWACDQGSEQGLTVALEVDEAPGGLSRTYARANLEREPLVARRCGTRGSAHGFELHPPLFAPGSHTARVVAYDGSGRSSRKLAACELVVPLRVPGYSEGPSGGGPRGHVDGCRAELIEGWACDAGSDARVMVELRLESDFGATNSSFYIADQEREPGVAERCGSHASDHGFTLIPPRMPPGSYSARILAYDAGAERSRELKECTVVFEPDRPL